MNSESLEPWPEKPTLPNLSRASISRDFVAMTVKKHHELLGKAIAVALSLKEPVSPWDFISRLTKNENFHGVTIFLDRSPILWIGEPQHDWRGYELVTSFPFQMIDKPIY